MDANSILLRFFLILIAVWLVELAVIGTVGYMKMRGNSNER